MILVGDIHLDKRFPFTNKKTLNRWRDLQTQTIENLLTIADPGETWIQLGDLFDSFMVSAEQFLRAQNLVATHCVALLAGNHDRSNDTDRVSAVTLFPRAITDVTEISSGSTNFILVPHQLTQESFEKALTEAELHIRRGMHNTLLLHCNFSDREGTTTENYLNSKWRQYLEDKFDYIVGGHEHNSRQVSSRTLALGSILPMNFGEMTDKHVMTRDGLVVCWSAEQYYRKWTYEQFLQEPVNHNLQFIEVVGQASVSDTLLVTKRIAAWYLESESIIAIKPSLSKQDEALDNGSNLPKQHESWQDFITNQLNDDEKNLFREILNAD